jgi:CRISPR-associated protein Csm1
MKNALLHTAALLLEIDHLQRLASQRSAIFPYPAWYELDPDLKGRIIEAHRLAVHGEHTKPNAQRQLQPVLPALAGKQSPLAIPLKPLGNSPVHIPSTPDPAAESTALWAALCAAAAKIQLLPATQYPLALQPILETYLSHVPAPDGPADISLYARAHVRTAFALAAALAPDPTKAQYALIGGDLSGIQPFIYDISTVFAAKLLKGRSFYVTLLCDSLRIVLLRHLGLTEAQTLIDSGGKFLLLAPANCLAKLPGIRAEIERKLWQSHGEALQFHLAGVAMEATEDFQTVLGKWDQALTRRRNRPFESILQADPSLLFAPTGDASGLAPRCSVTGSTITEAEAATIIDAHIGESDKQNLRLSTVARQQFDLGKWLKGAKGWTAHEAQPSAEKAALDPAGLGIWHHFPHSEAELNMACRTAIRCRLLNPETPDQAAQGHVWYGGAKFPADADGEPKTFDEIAGRAEMDAEGERNLVRLGYLRMDVDDLGKGIQQTVRSWVRYVAVSRSLDLFFKGHLEALRDLPQYRDHIVIVYAGGDDIFAVGRWVELAEFAKAVRWAFQAYCGVVAQPSISGGMVLTGAHFPIARASVLAGNAEDQAKDHGQSGIPKNSFSILGEALDWNVELPKIERLRDELLRFLAHGIFNTGLLQKLIRHHTDCLLELEAERKRDAGNADSDHLPVNWRWTAVWDLVRYRESLDKALKSKRMHAQADPEDAMRRAALAFINSHIEHIQKTTNATDNTLQQVAFAGIAARWAELLNRSQASAENTVPELFHHHAS